jgi:hypothetical protein
MKKFLVSLFVLCLSLGSFAQTASTSCQVGNPTEDPNCGLHFVAGSAFYQLSNGKSATEFDVRVPFTPRWSGFVAGFVVPGAQGNIQVGGADFRANAAKLFGKSAAASSSFNLSKIEIFGRAGLGSETNSVNSQRSFAYLAELGAELPVATVAGGPVVKIGARLAYLGVWHYGAAPERFVLGSNLALSPSLSVNFGGK